MKITSPTYQLPIVIGIDAHQQLLNSANQPLIITAVDINSGRKGEYVVKLASILYYHFYEVKNPGNSLKKT